jgi:hypothetical protein
MEAVMFDRRDIASEFKWWEWLNEKNMTAVVELPDPTHSEEWVDEPADEQVDVPFKWAVCGTCEGKGSHVNPSIDSHGLTAEDFGEDPDFAEDYHAGVYDVPCCECGGTRVVPVVDESRCSPELLERVNGKIEGAYDSAVERAHEREMGY